jgi:beta-galactosidase/beta-glucuronidase
MTHVIRLRGPWELEALERFGDAAAALPQACRTRVPGDWAEHLGQDFVGRVRYCRRFNTPTNLDAGERVWLVVEAVDHRATLALNGQPLGEITAAGRDHRFDITPLLCLHNSLEIDVTLPAEIYDDASARGDRAGGSGGLIGEVRLEIQTTGE